MGERRSCLTRLVKVKARETVHPFIQSVNHNHGIRGNVWQHAQIVNLIMYIRNLSTSSCKYKPSSFQKHKDFSWVWMARQRQRQCSSALSFILSWSYSHDLMEWNLKDPLWLDIDIDIDDPRFGKMAEVGRIIQAGFFVSDVPSLYFHKRYKGSGHPFYEYEYLSKGSQD